MYQRKTRIYKYIHIPTYIGMYLLLYFMQFLLALNVCITFILFYNAKRFICALSYLKYNLKIINK